MRAKILTAPAGAGKTAYLIDALLRQEADPFYAESWVLLPTRLQSEAFRDRLMQSAAGAAVFNIRFFNFYELYDLLLDLAGEPQRTISSGTSDRILRHVIHQLEAEGRLNYYHRIADKAGFVSLVSSFIKELKQGVVTLEKFTQAARNVKDQELALIYTHYQLFLVEHNLVDRDGAGWVALECLKRDAQLVSHVGLLAVDGFDDFNPLQAQLLAQLSQQTEATLLTLTYEAHRTADACRTFARTLTRLTETGSWQVEALPYLTDTRRAAPLAHLKAHLFAAQAAPLPADNHLRLIEAPDPRLEARAVLREVKQLLLDGVDPENILIVMRDSSLYAAALRSAAEAYDLPVVVRQSEALLENPAVRVVLNLLDLHSFDFPRRQLLDLLRSPYLKIPYFTPEALDNLERISFEKPIVRGREAWLRGLAAPPKRDDDDELGYAADHVETLVRQVEAFFDRLTPPPQATARQYVDWIEELLGEDPLAVGQDAVDLSATARHDLGFFACLREEAPMPDIVVRDLYAMHGFRAALAEILSAYDLLAEMRYKGEAVTIAWESFRADLQLALQRRMLSDMARRSRAGRVLITTVLEGRGLPHPFVFVLGLSEGIFPQRQAEDPLYSHKERQALAASGVDVQTEGGSEAGLFYEMCALAQQRLTLSRPTLDDGGNEWSPSAFWKNALELLADAPLTHIPPGAALPLSQAANQRELFVSLSRALNYHPDELPPAVWQAVGAVRDLPHWINLRRGRAIERGREAFHLPFDRFSGILRDPALIAEAARFIEDNIWSATQFNELGMCAFQFFSKRLLGLERYDEPEEGLDVLQLGSLNHAILEETYRRFQGKNLSFAPENLAPALDILYQAAEQVLETAPQRFGFQVTPLWEQEKANLLAKLEQVIRLDFSDDSPILKLLSDEAGPRYILRQEAPFGAAGEPYLLIGRGRLRTRGYIDRLDVVGDHVIVVDYKSGSHTPTRRDMEEGRNFQMLLYLLAANQMLARMGDHYRVRGGLFWSLHTNKAGGQVTTDDAAVQAAQDHLHRLVEEARVGRFQNQPTRLEGGKCSSYCEFSQFCRINRASLYKPLPDS